MIATFDAMSDMALLTQTGGIARGISEALITTQMGLSIALPGLLAQRVLQRRTRLLQHHIEHLSLSCLRILQS
jgi:biopolymer transport protein ExbB